MMEQAIEYGRSNGAVIIKDFRPVFEGAIGGEHNRTFLIAVADDRPMGSDSIEKLNQVDFLKF